MGQNQNVGFTEALDLTALIHQAITESVRKNNPSSEIIAGIVGQPTPIFNFFDTLLAEKTERPPAILRPLSLGEKLMIEGLDGQAIITKAVKVFQSSIDINFRRWDLDKPSRPTEEIRVVVHELVRSATFVQMFAQLSDDLDSLAMTQAQVIRFCEKYPSWLCQMGQATFFPVQVNGEHLVVRVRVRTDGLLPDVHRLGRNSRWKGENLCRLVTLAS